jgi:hypothetical protein
MGLRALGAGFTVLLFSMLGACDSLLEVENPGAVEATDLENPALAGTIVNSALGQFECALNSYVVSTSLLADETINSSELAQHQPVGLAGRGGRDDLGQLPGRSRRDRTGRIHAAAAGGVPHLVG